MDDDAPNFRNAHVLAQQLMDEPFFFSTIDESAPFGNEDGADTLTGFFQWRELHPDDTPLLFLRQQLADWEYPSFDLLETGPVDADVFRGDIELGPTMLIGTDAATIALAFAQLYLEGTIDSEVHTLAIKAADRQRHPLMLELWDEDYRPVREEQLGKILGALHKL